MTGPPAAGLRPPALAIRGLAKRFVPKIAVNSINLDVPAGSFYGLVGPNGAGKTTSLSMATGLLRPDAGSVWVDGVDVWGSPLEAKRLMGLLPDGVRRLGRGAGGPGGAGNPGPRGGRHGHRPWAGWSSR